MSTITIILIWLLSFHTSTHGFDLSWLKATNRTIIRYGRLDAELERFSPTPTTARGTPGRDSAGRTKPGSDLILNAGRNVTTNMRDRNTSYEHGNRYTSSRNSNYTGGTTTSDETISHRGSVTGL